MSKRNQRSSLKTSLIRSSLLLGSLVLLLSACAHNSEPLSPKAPEPPKRPPLSSSAKQPEPPEICKPTCLEGLTRLREELRLKLTSAESPASAVNAKPGSK